MSSKVYSWMHDEIRRIARERFETTYWSSIETVLSTYSQHSRVICSNKEKSIAAFVLVCTPQFSSHSKYGLEGILPSSFYEIAFVATDKGYEGRGYARQLLSEVLQQCQENNLNVWLHVDSINPRAVTLYESLGFRPALEIPDPYGSEGYIMVWLAKRRNCETGEGFALFNPSPCQLEQPFGRSILPPPQTTCC
jgi:ribosomal protein S18 acetylase RimI-like enzyme